MHTVRTPTTGASMQRSVAASLASILELDVAEVPCPGRAPSAAVDGVAQLARAARARAHTDCGSGELRLARALVGDVAGGRRRGLHRRGRVRRAAGIGVEPVGRPRDVRRGAARLRDRAGRCGAVGAVVRRCCTYRRHGRGHRGRARSRGVDGCESTERSARADRGLEGDRYFNRAARSPTPTDGGTISRSSRPRCSTA